MKRARIDTVPGLKDLVAEMHAEGATHREIADAAEVSDRGTVANWLKRPDVASLVQKIIADRASRILRHTDTAIEKILESEKKLTLKELLFIRDRFAGQQINLNVGGDKSKAADELRRLMAENPAMASQMKDALPDDPD